MNEAQIDVENLLEEAKKYQIEDAVNALIDYLNSDGRKKPEYFPAWSEYLIKAEEYGLI